MGSMAMGLLKKVGKSAAKKVESDMKDSAMGQAYKATMGKKKKARKA